ncbi:MAG: hypothetical protein ACHQYP_12725 [Nitrospiria bacterium]
MEQVNPKIVPFRFELPLFKPTGAVRLSGRPDIEKGFLVFLDVARALPGMVRVIPRAGGQKFDWTKKITFHLDLEDLAQWSIFLLDPAPSQPFVFYRKGLDQKEKKMTFIKREKQQYVVKTTFGKEEIVLTLLPSDIFLLTQGMKSLIEEMVWHGIRI